MGVGRWCIDCGNFEFVLRVARIYLSDIIGKRADLRISDRVLVMRSELKIVSVPNQQVLLFPKFGSWKGCGS